jgi:plasmid stabilization system protein ParE
MRSLRLRKTAREEIEDAFEWYGRQSATAPIRFLLALDEALANIREQPERFPVVTGSLRRTLLRRFPYAVYFQNLPANDQRGRSYSWPPAPANLASPRALGHRAQVSGYEGILRR